MKTVKLSVFNGKATFNKEFQVNHNLGQSKIIGTSLDQIFTANERLRKYGATHIKATDLVSVVITVNEEAVLDTYSMNSEYGFSLKFGRTAKSKGKFASCIHDLVTWAAEDVKPVSIEELIENLKKEA